jgi:hypothetical protein
MQQAFFIVSDGSRFSSTVMIPAADGWLAA